VEVVELTEDAGERSALADDPGRTAFVELFLEVRVLGLEPMRQLRDLGEEPGILDRDGGVRGEDAQPLELDVGERPAREHREHARHLVVEREGVAAERLEAVLLDPLLVDEARVPEQVVGADGRARRGDLADLQLADRDAAA
jgi:hypothetical protein